MVPNPHHQRIDQAVSISAKIGAWYRLKFTILRRLLFRRFDGLGGLGRFGGRRLRTGASHAGFESARSAPGWQFQIHTTNGLTKPYKFSGKIGTFSRQRFKFNQPTPRRLLFRRFGGRRLRPGASHAGFGSGFGGARFSSHIFSIAQLYRAKKPSLIAHEWFQINTTDRLTKPYKFSDKIDIFSGQWFKFNQPTPRRLLFRRFGGRRLCLGGSHAGFESARFGAGR